MIRIEVAMPAQGPAAYEVVLAPGALAALPGLLPEHAPAARYALVADDHVAPLHGSALLAALRAAGHAAELFTHPAGERHKTLESWRVLTDALQRAGFGRDGCIIALGGGVTGDLAGFTAATYLRGIPVVQVPTSLLAMVDASVGGKTGVDTPHGKNLVGAFHAPRLVLVDPLVLRTLPEVELRSGAAEAVKHGAIGDVAYLHSLHAHAARLLQRDPETATEVVRRSIELKAAVVSRDPLEHGERASLNFGHTLGHALEHVTGYAVPHGYAVSIGMVLAAEAGERAGITAPGTGALLRDALAALGLPVTLPRDVAFERLLEAARSDKKARAGRTRFVLLARPGEVARGERGEWTFPLPDSVLQSVL